MKKCSVEGCSRKHYCKTYCSLHYQRMVSYGHLEAPRIPLEARFWEKVNIGEPDECWEWQSAFRRDGYGVLSIKNKAMPVHRLSWKFAFGDHGKLWVLHKCDNKKCVNPAHLFLGTSKDNVHDMINKERAAVGTRQPGAKLTEDKVIAILQDDSSDYAIAKRFGISRGVIYKIKRGKAWKHVTQNFLQLKQSPLLQQD